MNLIGSFVIACSMYSKIPMPQVAWTEERMKYAMCFFPWIGVVIGAAMAAFGWLSVRFSLSETARACVGTAIPLLITGGIHMDGFLDVVDARSSYQPVERKLEILKDPHTGAFAIIGCGIYLLIYAGALAELSYEGILVFAGTFVLTRALSGLAVVGFPKAKNTGLAAAFSQQAKRRIVGIVMVLEIGAAAVYLWYFGGGFICAVSMAAALAVFGSYYRMAKKEFGGITGDLAGYFLQICELVLLILLAVVL